MDIGNVLATTSHTEYRISPIAYVFGKTGCSGAFEAGNEQVRVLLQ